MEKTLVLWQLGSGDCVIVANNTLYTAQFEHPHATVQVIPQDMCVELCLDSLTVRAEFLLHNPVDVKEIGTYSPDSKFAIALRNFGNHGQVHAGQPGCLLAVFSIKTFKVFMLISVIRLSQVE